MNGKNCFLSSSTKPSKFMPVDQNTPLIASSYNSFKLNNSLNNFEIIITLFNNYKI